METALITGANRGIGLALARQLKDRGYQVIGACRTASPELHSLDVQIEEGVDVSRGDSLRQLANNLRGHRISLLIHNAGIGGASSLNGIEDELDSWRKQYEVNALGPLRVTRALINHLRNDSKIAILTSRMGSIDDNSSGGHWAYRMSKAAVNMAGVTLAHELKDRNIAVALLHPGFVRTDMTRGQGDVGPEEAAAGLVRRIDELNMDNSGGFWHANGERLPW